MSNMEKMDLGGSEVEPVPCDFLSLLLIIPERTYQALKPQGITKQMAATFLCQEDKWLLWSHSNHLSGGKGLY